MTSIIPKKPISLLEEKPWASFLDWTNLLERGSFASLDVEKGDNEMTVLVDLPGVFKEDIDLSYENDRLFIKAQREREESSQDGYFHRERSWGEVERSLYLAGVDPDSIEASLKGGVLRIKMNLPEERGRHIAIESK